MSGWMDERQHLPGTHHHFSHTSPAEARLLALGELIPKTERDIEHMASRRHALVALGLSTAVLVMLTAWGGVAWMRPVGALTFHAAATGSARLPGPLPSLPWPATGSAALAASGGGSLGTSGGSHPVPIAGVAEVMTAYLVVYDHPLVSGAPGPAIAVTDTAVASYRAGAALRIPVLPLVGGEQMSELQALEGMLVARGSDLAVLLAEWDAGTEQTFVGKMNAAAATLGLRSTTFADSTGLDPRTTSTPGDLIRLGEAAMASPVLAGIVAMAQVTLPVVGTVYNSDSDLGHDGMAGIAFGSSQSAGGCFLFWAHQVVAGRIMTVIGAELGQVGTSRQATAMGNARALVIAAFAQVGTFRSLEFAGGAAGSIHAPWGSSTSVTADPVEMVGWPGEVATIRFRTGPLAVGIRAGTQVGTAQVDLGGGATDLVLRAAGPVHGPPTMWRITRS